MENRILGIHHITAIAGNAKRNYDFYTKVLGLRMVKKTVNFDDPATYHFYFGDEVGSPGTILTFFPWEGISRGRVGTGMATEIGYSVPEGSFPFWIERFIRYNVKFRDPEERFGERTLVFEDPDGLKLSLIIPKQADRRKPWTVSDVSAEVATRGFHNITLTLKSIEGTASVLTEILGYRQTKREGNLYRFVTDAVDNAAVIDLIEDKESGPGNNAGGTIHHLAFRVKDEQILMDYRAKVATFGLGITEKIDRNYFFSLYFREPGGVLFEIATDNPGFAVDEALEELGQKLKLPSQYEKHRDEIEKVLPLLN